MSYDTDLTDGQWQEISSFIPAPLKGGRRRSTSEREVVNAIFYLLKTGCQWRQLGLTDILYQRD
jgi:putative transposase